MSDDTKPQLRERLKDEIQAGDKRGRKGQWSARKAQRLVQEEERQGGGHTDASRSAKQEHLADWGDQDAKGDDRYLPDVAWKLLSRAEQEGEPQLQRARHAEADHGDGRKTVLEAIDKCLRA